LTTVASVVNDAPNHLRRRIARARHHAAEVEAEGRAAREARQRRLDRADDPEAGS
jgi:hypothetical protein